MSGTDDVLYKKFQAAGVEYRASIRDLDAVMAKPHPQPGQDFDLGTVPKLDVEAPTPRAPRAEPRVDDSLAPEPVVSEADPALFSDEALARRRARMQEGAGNRAAAADGSLYNLAPDAPTPMAKAARDPNLATGQMAVDPSESLAASRNAPLHAPIQSGNDLPAWHKTGEAPRDPAVDPDLTPNETPKDAPVRSGPTSGPTWEKVVEPLPQDPSLPYSKPRPIDTADAHVQQAMADLVSKTGGRLDSASALGILEGSGIRPAADNVGSYMDQVYALRKAGILAADATRGAKNPLTAMLEGAAVGGLGHMVAGPAGAAAAVVADLFLKRGGRVAAATGRLMGTASQAASKMLTSNRVRAVAAAAANTPHAYSERGPIEDPIERIQEIQWLAANPVHIAAKVADSARDLADQPQMLQALQARTVNQIQRLAVRAPAIYFDKLGRPLAPPGGKMREFFEYENAIHDLPGLLEQMAKGGLTGPQAAALQEAWPSVHIKVTSEFLSDPEKLRNLPRATLRAVENITGIPLTNAKDPAWLARQAQAWMPPEPQAPPGKPQAFNINPAGAPTPTQSTATGRAPGN
jgi:hypothetical protein